MPNLWCDDISEIASDQRPTHKAPPVGDDKEGQFEWQRNDDWRDHHHAHGHQNCRDNQIDDQERKKNQEPDLKGAFDLT